MEKEFGIQHGVTKVPIVMQLPWPDVEATQQTLHIGAYHSPLLSHVVTCDNQLGAHTSRPARSIDRLTDKRPKPLQSLLPRPTQRSESRALEFRTRTVSPLGGRKRKNLEVARSTRTLLS